MNNIDDWQTLLLARYQTFSDEYVLCIGEKTLKRKDILNHIEKLDDIGLLLIRIEQNYFNFLKNNSGVDGGCCPLDL